MDVKVHLILVLMMYVGMMVRAVSYRHKISDDAYKRIIKFVNIVAGLATISVIVGAGVMAVASM